MTALAPGSVVENHPTLWLQEGWRLARTPPGACDGPQDLGAAAREWHDAKVPGTVAASLAHDLDLPGNFDADDWWYRCQFTLCACAAARYYLRFEGLATLADVWLNGTKILESRSMFMAHRVEVGALLRESNELVVAFRSLGAALEAKRPRPRWKTALVSQQNLRWFRTTLLGRIPGWTPAVTPVGPYAPIALERVERFELASLRLHADAAGTTGRLELDARLAILGDGAIDGARLHVGDEAHPVEVARDRDTTARLRAYLSIPDAPLWFPHTHGTPALVRCRLEVSISGEAFTLDLGKVGLRHIAVDRADGGVRFIVNGAPVFCRGACWTPPDFAALRTDAATLRRALELARDGGVNMLRVGGAMLYESHDFYRLCDELGILVWQDFMFANMDYPVADSGFRAAAEAECAQQLDRLHRHPCIAAYCGGSEVAQQSAMLGLGAEHWSNGFFDEALPRLCAERHPGSAYFPSSPWGGALPFHVSAGIAHYYGVGAYRRPLEDVKSARVRFATECLGISNVPDAGAMEVVPGTALPPPHHPRWKARVPRDSGSGYDFEDVRDHYLRVLFGRDPVALRATDLERYYAMSRAVSGEVMRAVFAEWRAPRNPCAGALVWFWKDLWAGAGWGVVDGHGRPKAAYWYLRRAWRACSVHLTDDGLDGVGIHAINEGAQALDAKVELALYHSSGTVTARADATLRIPARGAVSLQGDALLGRFTDSTYAYRFGPAAHHVVATRMTRAETGEVLAEDFHFPAGMDLPVAREVALEAECRREPDGSVVAVLRSPAFLQAVRVECEGYAPDDNYFHLAPLREKRIRFVPAAQTCAFSARVGALNWAGERKLAA